MVSAVIVAAVRNAGYKIPEGAIEEAIARAVKVPGGWCGSHGACGAAIGVGVAVSILTEATPITGKPRALANEGTLFALSRMLGGYPRCCKRASRQALEAAVEFLRNKMNIVLPVHQPILCSYSWRNKECAKEDCSYYAAGNAGRDQQA
jgi:hypothetical protein